MIKWKSLFFFILTLTILIGALGGGTWFAYDKAVGFIGASHPEIQVTPKSTASYSPDPNLLKQLVEYSDDSYTIMLPKGFKSDVFKGDPTVYLSDPQGKWEISLSEKLLRYEDTIQSDRFLENPTGDYYVLLDNIFTTTRNPILLLQKMKYLPSSTTHIKYISTPHLIGFYIVASQGEKRYEIYRLFDNQYWHNVTVSINDPAYPHDKIETFLATLNNSRPKDGQTKKVIRMEAQDY